MLHENTSIFYNKNILKFSNFKLFDITNKYF